MTDKTQETHGTCTSTDLDSTPGSRPEHINVSVLNDLHEKQTGVCISSDPVVARIQREQAIARDKRVKRGT
jgi:hypothetical protein